MLPQVLIAANRLPVSWAVETGAERRLVASPGGLVSALTPVAERLRCTWIGALEGSSGIEFDLAGMRLLSLDPDAELFDRYYRGFANQILWPLFHGLPGHVGAETGEWWSAYEAVNRLFAERIAAAAGEGSLVWVHDYHLLLVPEMLRKLRPDLRIVFFLHIPFPELDALAAHPWAVALVHGLLAADLIGVQRQVDADRLEMAREKFAAGAPVNIGVFPISIDTQLYLEAAAAALPARAPVSLRERLGVGQRSLLMSVDRLDYTKGITARIAAFEEVLERWEDEEGRPVLVQAITPTRQDIARYRGYAADVAAMTERVNERFAAGDYTPIVTLGEPHTAAQLVELFLAADVMCITPLRDGMNLVAKEFVATRIDQRGVLLLGCEAGSADELTGAVLTDPHDHDDLVAAIIGAIAMAPEEQEVRMRELRAQVLEHDVHAWAANFLAAAGGLPAAT